MVPRILALLAALAAGTHPVHGATAVFGPLRDNTIYADVVTNSNGAGEHVFAGRTSGGAGNGSIRRGLMAFDLTSIPAGSTITSVTLELYCSKASPGSAPQTINLHRASARWGEGTSDGGQEEGAGGLATPNDATWLMRFYPGSPWVVAGGDFVAAPSASTVVGLAGFFYTWSSPGMVADVQGWVNIPLTSQGWFLRGNETVDKTVRRFGSRNNLAPVLQPKLTVVYTSTTSSLGATPDGSDDLPGEPLRVAHAGGSEYFLTWGASCVASADDYAVYEGAMGDFEDYEPVTCSTAGAESFTLTPPAHSVFWLVVPVDPTRDAEGSYGWTSDGDERPPSTAACFSQLIDDPLCP